MKKDPKYLGVPNICFSLTEREEDETWRYYTDQRLEKGFDDSETWCLTTTIAQFIIPRLERYEQIAVGFLERDEKDVAENELFLEAMKLIVRDNGLQDWNKEEEKIVMKGLKLFPKIFLKLWW